jgi:hypothetical protein
MEALILVAENGGPTYRDKLANVFFPMKFQIPSFSLGKFTAEIRWQSKHHAFPHAYTL